MTIAVCSICPEGVVLGADSTSSFMAADGFHFLNHNQKIFEIGKSSTVAAVTWGLASTGTLSHRGQLALLDDAIKAQGLTDIKSIANLWVSQFWQNYQTYISPQAALLKALHAKGDHDPTKPNAPGTRTRDEQEQYVRGILGLSVGFCIAGHSPTDRQPCAFEIKFDPLADKPPTPAGIGIGDTRCWGAPKIFSRLVLGIDPDLKTAILGSGKWGGTSSELDALLTQHQMYLVGLPIRDAIDFVYSIIASTIKTIKFSQLPQVCGGPIEIAAITVDREFRWVRHKDWDVAIKEGQGSWKT